MRSVIRFSLFGNYEQYGTENIDIYMKMIDFFGKKGYKPSTSTELLLNPEGQTKAMIMPKFSNDNSIEIEMTSNRINFQKTVNVSNTVEQLNDYFKSEVLELMFSFVENFGIVAKRIALNCEILRKGVCSDKMTVSSYYDDTDKIEMSLRNVGRKIIKDEETNIIIEKDINTLEDTERYVFDINSVAQNQKNRFDNTNMKLMYDSYVEVALQVEKGMK